MLNATRPAGYSDAIAWRGLGSPASFMDAPDTALASVRPRVLLVENDPQTSASLVEVLRPYYEVEAVSDGLAGWYAGQRQRPDLVIIGLSISGKDRLILTRALRGDRRMATPPIVLLTASCDRELLLACLAAGANNFLLKPFAEAELLACVRLALKSHPLPEGES